MLEDSSLRFFSLVHETLRGKPLGFPPSWQPSDYGPDASTNLTHRYGPAPWS